LVHGRKGERWAEWRDRALSGRDTGSLFWPDGSGVGRRSGRSNLAEDLSAPSYYWWCREPLRRDQPKPAFLPVPVLPGEAEAPIPSIDVVLANGRCLRIALGFDPQTLVQLMELLENGGRSC